MAKSYCYLFSLLFVMCGCEKDDEKDPLYQQLVGTTWVMDRVEVLDKSGTLISSFNASFPNNSGGSILCTERVLNFRNDQHVVIGRTCSNSGSGCGQYLFSNGKISFSILEGQAVIGLCQVSNFAYLHVEKSQSILLEGNMLRMDGWSSSFSRLSAEANWVELRDLYNLEQIVIQTYYKPTSQTLVSDLACCGNLSLIP